MVITLGENVMLTFFKSDNGRLCIRIAAPEEMQIKRGWENDEPKQNFGGNVNHRRSLPVGDLDDLGIVSMPNGKERTATD